jgi:2-polyprenyl-3-methyl-5-hydroxy-6-metoxy-1,4-benzoquinol methylase
MINSSKWLEGIFQRFRFNKALKYLKGDILDFGGNEGELRKFVQGNYTLVNYDHSPMENKSFDTVVALAVVEHIEVDEVFRVFSLFKLKLKPNGNVFLTTPTPFARPVLELMASMNLLEKHNIEEHKHYWTKNEIFELARKNGFVVKEYKRFQLGFNQMALFEATGN